MPTLPADPDSLQPVSIPHAAPESLPPDDYARRVRADLAAGRRAPDPATRDQAAVLPAVAPDLAAAWRPAARELRFLDLPLTYGRPVRPFGVEWRQRLLATVEADPRFRDRLARLLGVR